MATGKEAGDGKAAPDPYVVRRFRPDDRDDVLDLDRVVWGRDRSPEWFRWKYERNPFVDRVPVFVAERDGEIVGARPFMAFRLRAGETVVHALQPSDTMVHPDHRRRGLFSRMTERAIDAYADGKPSLCFNFPNDVARGGYEKLGWRAVHDQLTYYRIQNPGSLLSSRFDDPIEPLVRRFLAPLTRVFRRDPTDAPAATDVQVEGHRGVPHSTLATLYERRVPDRIHAVRDETFLRWRFGSPAWSRTTYLANRAGATAAGLVARTRTLGDDVTVTQIADVVPMTGGEQWSRTVGRLLAAAIREHPRSDLISISPGDVSPSLLHALGFRPDDRPVLSWLCASNKTLVVRPLSPDEDELWTLAGRELTRPGCWAHSFVERDTA